MVLDLVSCMAELSVEKVLLMEPLLVEDPTTTSNFLHFWTTTGNDPAKGTRSSAGTGPHSHISIEAPARYAVVRAGPPLECGRHNYL